MANHRNFFHIVSYSQYPLIFGGVYFIAHPLLFGLESPLESWNIALLFIGLGVSMSTLQDTTITQNKVSKRVWEDPKKGKVALLIMSLTALMFIASAFMAMFLFKGSVLEQLSFGLLALGIAYVGLLRAAIEMFENHRKDKNSASV